MTDYREEFLMKVKNSLLYDLSPDILQIVLNTIIVNLDTYELSKRITDLVVPDTTTDQILKLYAGSILTEGKSRKTATNYIKVLRRFSDDICKPILNMNVFDCRAWLARFQSTLKLSTIENYRSYLSAFYIWCVKEEILSKNPMSKITPIKFPEKIEKAFTDTEIDNFRMNCKNLRERAIMEFLLASGIRADELINLNKTDIDFQTLEVSIREGKGRKSRVTYINDLAKRYLIEYLNTRTDNDICLFYSRNKQRLQYSTLRLNIEELGKRAGVLNTHCHRFRKTFATNLYNRGMSVRDIQLLLGHTSLEVTQRYLCTNSNHVKNEYNRFN